MRLAAANLIAETFESHITGLFFGAGVNQAIRLLDRAREAGNVIEATVFERLTRLQQPTNLRRFDVADDSDIADTALPLARAADTFVADTCVPTDRAEADSASLALVFVSVGGVMPPG